MKNSHPRINLTSLLTAAFLALASTTFAVDPPPDGGYPNQNTAEGEDALLLGGNLSDNTAIGYHAIYTEQYGGGNTGIGSNVLASLFDAVGNTAVGYYALSADTYASYNTAVGYEALNGVTTYGQSHDTALGYRAMALSGSYGCTAIGFQTLLVDQGELNVAIGNEALNQNTTGVDNTAVGWRSLFDTTTGYSNVGLGTQALFYNTNGNQNIAIGEQASLNNTSGSNNIVIGARAGINLTHGDNNIDIANAGVADEAGVIRLGAAGTQTATYVAGILSSPLAVATGVGITTDGRLGVRASSARFKEAIKPMDKASETILSLRPVSFRYKKELDPTATPQFGLVAEEVEKVDPNLVAHDASGKPYTVRYEEVNAMLLNEFLKEHRSVQELKTTAARQQKEIETLTATLKAQAAQIQKVSDQLGTQVPAPRVVANN